MPIERFQFAPGLSISRVITGLWQVADMERDGRKLDAEATSLAMEQYATAGLTTFDMADHYGSAEVIAGRFRDKTNAEVPAADEVGAEARASHAGAGAGSRCACVRAAAVSIAST